MSPDELRARGYVSHGYHGLHLAVGINPIMEGMEVWVPGWTVTLIMALEDSALTWEAQMIVMKLALNDLHLRDVLCGAAHLGGGAAVEAALHALATP